jgi:hypothetical protein
MSTANGQVRYTPNFVPSVSLHCAPEPYARVSTLNAVTRHDSISTRVGSTGDRRFLRGLKEFGRPCEVAKKELLKLEGDMAKLRVLVQLWGRFAFLKTKLS